jgi:hypothetical protein
MSGRFIGALARLAACLSCSCSFGAFQTAHTQAPATASVTPGIARIWNRIDAEAGRGLDTNVGGQLGARVGIARHVDAGLGTFLGSGVKADVKVNLLQPEQRFALAPRLGAGYRSERSVRMLEGGAIASYRFDPLEPYIGLAFANHWMEPALVGQVPANAARKTGVGDGLLQLSVGVELPLSKQSALLMEYGHWFPLNDDPGDFYSFLPANIVGLALRVGFSVR